MSLPEITRAARVVPVSNLLLFVGALISALAIPLSIRANNGVQELKDSEAARLRTEDQRKIEAANSWAETADSKARMLRTDLERALLRQKGLERRNRDLSISLQSEYQARLQLEVKVSPRHLSDGQIETLTRLLLPFRGSSIVFTRVQDQEAWEFAEDVLRPLYLAGWQLSDNDVGVFVPPQYGILLCVPEQSNSHTAALALATALREAHIDFSIQIVSDDLRLIVGLKPSRS